MIKKKYIALFGVLALIPLAWGQSATNDPPATNESSLSLTIDLVDGSRIIGIPDIASIHVQTDYAKLDVALKNIKTLTMEKDREMAVFEMGNGDRIKGALIIKSLKLQTVFGQVTMGAERIVKITVDQAAMRLGARTKFNVAEDFSLKDNPAGPWSYGWIQIPGADFKLFQIAGKDGPHIGLWELDEGQNPVVGINTSDETLVRPTTVVHARQMMMHPGSKGECAVIRWKATRTGVVKVAGKFCGLSGRNGGGPLSTVDVHIFHWEKEVFASGINLPGRGNDSPFDIKVDVRMGDTIDFVVGYGNSNNYDDLSGLDATIDY